MASVPMLSVCLGLVLVSLLLVSMINRVQTRKHLRRAQVQTLMRQIVLKEELCQSLEALLERVDIVHLINSEILEMIKAVQELDPTARHIEPRLTRSEQLEELYRNRERSQSVQRAMGSDAAIAQSKYYLTEAARVVRRQHTVNKITFDQFETYFAELNWAELMVDLVTLIGQGYKAADRGDFATSAKFYRKAWSMLNQKRDLSLREKTLKSEIEELIKGARQSISPEFIPEIRPNRDGPSEDMSASQIEKLSLHDRSA